MTYPDAGAKVQMAKGQGPHAVVRGFVEYLLG